MIVKINFKKLIICIAIPLGLGILSGLITSGSMEQFKSLDKPPLSPPAIVFPIVWSILYVLMGIASYFVLESGVSSVGPALRVYALQLIFNIIWPIIFFNLNMYLLAFIWLVILFLLVCLTTLLFYSCNKAAGYLMLPYLVWLVIAGYLNLGIYLLN
ncbi:MAG: tryptophan-rich sensory protein [Clostridia bacterium]|nr:tryptophan-rich sensory protein [Clostridia bacterium]